MSFLTPSGPNMPVLDFWSILQEEVQLPAVAAPVAMPDIVVAGIPAGAVIVRAALIFTWRALENTNVAANKLNGAQHIQCRLAAGVFADAISLAANLFAVAASTREGGDAVIGDHNLVATVTGNGTYNVQWTAAVCDVANLNFNDIQVGLRIWYHL